jgi:predicted transcriptional regulator
MTTRTRTAVDHVIAREFTLAVAKEISQDTDTNLLAMRDGRKERVGEASLAALAAMPLPSYLRRGFSLRADSDLVVLDADSFELAEAARSVVESAKALGLTPVVLTSGRPGHIHVWLRTDSEEQRSQLTDQAKQLGVDTRAGAFMRPPLSPHPAGLPTELLEPATLDAAFLALKRPTSKHPQPPTKPKVPKLTVVPTPSRAMRREALPPLSAAMRSVLEHGDGCADRSRTLQRIVTAAVNAGWTLEQAWGELSDPGSKFLGVAKLTEKIEADSSGAKAFKYLEHCWGRAERWVLENPRSSTRSSERDIEVLNQLNEFEEFMEEDPAQWSGPSGPCTWLVLHALVQICKNAATPTLTPTASERQLAENCAMSRTAVSESLQRLMASGWLIQVHRGSGPKASLWALPVKKQAGGPSSSSPALASVSEHPEPIRSTNPSTSFSHSHRGCEDSGVDRRELRSSVEIVVDLSHDAFRSGALGALGYRVLRHLARNGECTVAEVAAALGCHTGSVSRLLRARLGASGLVERLGDGSWRVLDLGSGLQESVNAGLIWAAHRFATLGLGAAQKRFHQAERELYRAALDDWVDQGWWVAYERGDFALATAA